jgi:two-component system, chemotaxis family, chemotaxis protein CheY
MGRQPLIALVDDDAIFQFTASRTILATNLTSNIRQFNHGEEALMYLRKHAEAEEEIPDLIFLDINMPVTDGWMFLEEFDKVKSKLSKDVTIYMVSSSIDPTDIARAKANKLVTDYLMKPLERQTVAGIIQAKLAS